MRQHRVGRGDSPGGVTVVPELSRVPPGEPVQARRSEVVRVPGSQTLSKYPDCSLCYLKGQTLSLCWRGGTLLPRLLPPLSRRGTLPPWSAERCRVMFLPARPWAMLADLRVTTA